MKPPIIVVTDDVDLFSSPQEAERYLEPPEVPGMRAWDGDGRPLNIRIERRRRVVFSADFVRIDEHPDSAPDIEGARAALIRRLSGVEDAATLRALSLSELIDRAMPHLTR